MTCSVPASRAACSVTCATPRAGPTASMAGPRPQPSRWPTCFGPGPGRPHRRFADRDQRRHRRFPWREGSDQRRTRADHHQERQRIAGAVRNLGRGPAGDDAQRPVGSPGRLLLTLPARYRAHTAADLDQAARAAIDPKGLTWVVVGDAAKVRPQLEKVGMPIQAIQARGQLCDYRLTRVTCPILRPGRASPLP